MTWFNYIKVSKQRKISGNAKNNLEGHYRSYDMEESNASKTVEVISELRVEDKKDLFNRVIRIVNVDFSGIKVVEIVVSKKGFGILCEFLLIERELKDFYSHRVS